MNLKKLEVPYQISEGATCERLDEAQSKLGVTFPEQVREFYGSIDGMTVSNPKLEVYSISKLKQSDSLIEFALFDGAHHIGFDTQIVNIPGQWDIINLDTGYVVTHTMASFWSNKIWVWLRHNRKIWQQEFDT